ncbi:MAG: putative bacteriocin export ABC transporter [Streptococcaceae bacterium]|jgi:putative ABC transport system ATP-binding protein|nr:putative bacteriocin export ABC transporter [Streptococcaceae bacterium]
MIKLENIEKKFDEKVVFENVDYRFEKGKSYALVGASGSGKTTLLNIIGKLEAANSGTVKVDDKELSKIKEQIFFRDYVGYLFQNYGLIENESIEQNLDLAFVGKKVSKSDKKQQMREALERVNLALGLNRKIYSLSGGEAQRVAIAKIILKNPPIILADEPTASLDEKNTREVLQLILGLLGEDKIIIIATHNPKVWESCDEVVKLSEGQING